MIYFDNAATTFPKPTAIEEAVVMAMRRYGANPGRSGHSLSINTAVKVYETREAAARFFGAASTEHVVFTQNCTHAINLALKGILERGDHVIISDLEHNSVLRPVHALAERGLITYSIANTGLSDEETLENVRALINPSTRLIAYTHGSNVWGIRLPIAKIGALAKENNILLLADCAQTAGVVDIDVQRDNIDFFCCPGHKGLYGPAGTGLLITHLGGELKTLMEGGTGTFSAEYDQPGGMPEKLECGTLNTVGIIALRAGIEFVRKGTISALSAHEMEIIKAIQNRLSRFPRLQLPAGELHNLPVLSFTIDGMTSEDIVGKLSERGFALRGGLHCAPLAHRKMNTLHTGAARISAGAFNTLDQAFKLCDAIEDICFLEGRRPSKPPFPRG